MSVQPNGGQDGAVRHHHEAVLVQKLGQQVEIVHRDRHRVPIPVDAEEDHGPGQVGLIIDIQHLRRAVAHQDGQAGNAVADILFGNVSPSGKLCVSYPAVEIHEPVCYNYGLEKDHRIAWPFGYGLSYASFKYGNRLLGSHFIVCTFVNSFTASPPDKRPVNSVLENTSLYA